MLQAEKAVKPCTHRGLSALSASTVFAAAGDTISNTATLTFDVGGTPTVIESSEAGNSTTGIGNGTSTDFVEDKVINFTVAEVGGTTTSLGVVPNATLRVQTFTVTNDGNAPQDFLLAALNQANGTADPHGGVVDNFDATSVQVFVETDSVAGYTAADTAIFINELAATASATVYIVSTIPGTVVNGDLAVLTLVAQVAEGGTASADDAVAANAGAAIANDDNGHVSPAGTYNNGVTAVAAGVASTIADVVTTMQTVFNDAAGDVNSAGAADVVQNGQHSDSDSYTVGAAVLTVTKTASLLWDPANGNSNPKAIPGAYMQYTITVANDAGAGASGDLTTLGDTLASMGLDPDLIDGTTAALAEPGAPESAAGDSFRVDTSGTGRNAALNVSTLATNYCTAAADADGCDYAGATLTIDYTLLESMDAEAGYTAGELKAGESVVIVFNAVIQ